VDSKIVTNFATQKGNNEALRQTDESGF